MTEPRQRRVLLADPDAARRRATAIHLRLGGYRVVEVGALAEIPAAARDGIDIVVSQAELSDGSAIGYAAYLRKDPRTASLPILIATHDASAAEGATAAIGRDGVLVLPLAPSVLLDRVRALLAAPA